MWDKKEPESSRGSQQQAAPRADTFPSASGQPVQASGVKGRAANIGGSLFIKGEVSGSEDMTVEGRVEGKIHLKDHNITIAQNGRVNAEIHARSVTVHGELTGNVHADEKIEISETGRLTGDLFAPRVAISDGAQFRGSVDMGKSSAAASVAPTIREKVHERVQEKAHERIPERPQVQVAQVAAQGKMAG